MFESRMAKRAGMIAVLAGMCLALSACLLTPGKFNSQLDVRRDGRFTFSYTGEIYLIALSRLATMAKDQEDGSDDVFIPQPCYKDDKVEERDCTAAERSEQKADWGRERERQVEREKRDNEAMKAMLGGIDPADPKAAEELAARLRRQVGWKKVEYKGDGLFDVDFSHSGRLDHDFVFPTLERFPMANSFVTAVRRTDGSLRIDAPGFAPASGGDPFRSLLQVASLEEKAKGGKGEDAIPRMPELDGTFAIVTDATILANNTDEGPVGDAAGQKLNWKVNIRAASAPTALLKLN
jgi:hypothetical protein